MTRPARWLAWDLRLLRRYCPVTLPVVVERPRRLRWWADACRYTDHFLIRLDARLDAVAGREVLAHEWAHCRAWSASRIDHGAAWGIEYARCYRVLFDGWRPKR